MGGPPTDGRQDKREEAELLTLPAQLWALLKAIERELRVLAGSDANRSAWTATCGQGLKPQTVSPTQLDALQVEAGDIYGRLGSDQQTALAVARIGGLAAQLPRLDRWATCGRVGIAPSSTSALDGSYQEQVTVDELAPGDCRDCGNEGSFTLVVKDGRYALLHPTPPGVDVNSDMGQFQSVFGPSDPVEVGSVIVTGQRSAWRPQTNMQYGSAPFVYDFVLFRGKLTWHAVSGDGFSRVHPWARLP